MERQVPQEQRELLLDNPDLVMFDPYSVMKTHRVSLGIAVLPPIGVLILCFIFGMLFTEALDRHSNLFAGTMTAAVVIAAAFIPVLYFYLDHKAFRKAKQTHYRDQLRQLMPPDLTCNVVTVNHVTREKAEGSYICDGKEEVFGYVSFVNTFRIEPGEEMAVLSGDRFYAFVKRDPRTKWFYGEESAGGE